MRDLRFRCPRDGLSFFGSITNRLHVHTCTVSPVTCSITGGDRGARAYELALDAVLDQKLRNARSPVGFLRGQRELVELGIGFRWSP